jgi:hypothetical protein
MILSQPIAVEHVLFVEFCAFRSVKLEREVVSLLFELEVASYISSSSLSMGNKWSSGNQQEGMNANQQDANGNQPDGMNANQQHANEAQQIEMNASQQDANGNQPDGMNANQQHANEAQQIEMNANQQDANGNQPDGMNVNVRAAHKNFYQNLAKAELNNRKIYSEVESKRKRLFRQRAQLKERMKKMASDMQSIEHMINETTVELTNLQSKINDDDEI